MAEALLPELGPKDLVVASSDLSHYHPDPVARRLDAKTLKRALALDAEGVAQGEACGRLPWSTLTALARALGWKPRLLAYATSAEARGGRERVVGYGALAYVWSLGLCRMKEMTPVRRRFSVEEFHRMARAGLLGEDDRVELLEGEIWQMSPIGSRHAACLRRLRRLFTPWKPKAYASSPCRTPCA